MNIILHIAASADWQHASVDGYYAPSSLSTEGFIHCSTLGQTVETANRFFHGQKGLLLLCIDEDRVEPEVRYESPATKQDERYHQQFPHIYGPLNLGSVLRVFDFKPRVDGGFELPAEVYEIHGQE